mgnify:CR=1 FL=1
MVKLKICGMRRLEDIEMANEYKPDYIGFVFAESPRRVSYNQAKELSANLCEDVVPVGVFVDEHMKLIVDLFKNGIIEMAQLHGDEDEEYIRNLKAKSLEEAGREIPVINGIEIRDDGDYDDILLKCDDSLADYFILDSGKGSGKIFNWDLINKNSGMFKNQLFLAGGLNSENLDLAIREFNPFAVDLSSGAETNGFKDEEKIKEIVKIIEDYNSL